MRIGFVSPYYYPAMIGGIEWYLHHVTRTLASRGHQVAVYTTRGDGKGGRLPPEESVQGVAVRRFSALVDSSYRLKLWPHLLPALSRSDVEVLHVLDYAQFHNLAVALSRPSGSWSSVVAVYDIHSEIPRSRLKSGPMKAFDRYGARWALRGYDKILVRTPFQTDFLRGLGIDDGRVQIAPPGLDPFNYEDPSRDQIDDALRRYAPNGEKLILYVGRMHPIKGIDVLIKATAIVRKAGLDVRTLVVGPDPHGYRDSLAMLAKELGIAECVVFTGYLDEIQKWVLQSVCDLAVLPSSFEGFGQSLIQAMARGKPVIGTRVGGIPWVLEDGACGVLVGYGDEQELAHAMTEILQDGQLARKLSDRARLRAAEFSYPKLVDDLESIYSSLGNKSRR